MEHPLDNPVWSALTSRHAALALRAGDAARYRADVAPFVAVDRYDSAAEQELLGLVEPGESVCLVGRAPRLSSAWRHDSPVPISQMLCRARLPVPAGVRKKRRRTSPVTTTSVPAARPSAADGGSNHATGTDAVGRSGWRTVTSNCPSWSPEGSVRSSGSRDKAPRRMTTFMETSMARPAEAPASGSEDGGTVEHCGPPTTAIEPRAPHPTEGVRHSGQPRELARSAASAKSGSRSATHRNSSRARATSPARS